MNRTTKLALGIAAGVAAGVLLYRVIRRQKENNRLRNVSNEGYETAHDVLYPTRQSGKDRLKYGPVLPQ